MTTFTKQQFNQNFNHQSEIVKLFNEMGYTQFKIETCLTNGLSHYIRLNVSVLNARQCWADMYINDDNTTDITIRISDHTSNLSRFGVVGNKMDLTHFKLLLSNKAISNSN